MRAATFASLVALALALPTYGEHLGLKGKSVWASGMRLGHKNIQHTVRYTELAPDRFKGFWKD
jgi:hypothetical protein